jgi:hypothetical protein
VSVRRILIAAAVVLVTVGGVTGTAWTEVPSHEREINKDLAITIPAEGECPFLPGAATIDLVFNEQLHLTLTSDTFHFTDTLSGTFTLRDAHGNALSTGHLVSTSSGQFRGLAGLASTEIIKVNGVTADGSRVNQRVLSHTTVTPDGTVRDFHQVSC